MTRRLDTIRQLADAHDAHAALVTHPPSLRWAVGFTGSNGMLVVTETAAHLVTDGRYTTQARAEVEGATIHIAEGPLGEYVEAHVLLGDARSAVLQGESVTMSDYERLRDALAPIRLMPVRDLLSEAVAAKSEAEVEAVRQSQALTCEVFEAILPMLSAGVTERAIAAEIVCEHLRRGASAMAFEPIVATGPRGALPHARPSDRSLAPGDLVVIDMGGVLDGFCSDLTRTVAVGEPGEAERAAYATVLAAQRAAIKAAHAGLTGRQLDTVARDLIEADGLGPYFAHSLGHGVGREIHEWPRLSQQVEHTLPAGATVTIEPGVYLPDRFGIRIEDVIVLRPGGCQNLTPLPTDLVVV